ncbi:MAG: hypothetical protein LBE06_11680, partial [Azoarcus sp.]|nr:hypothetical protein [Azoarcus sp.]
AEKNRVGQSLLAAAIELGRDDIISIDKPVKRAVLRPGTTVWEVRVDGRTAGSFASERDARIAARSLAGNVAIRKTNDLHVVYTASPMLADNETLVYVKGYAIRLQINDALMSRAYGRMGQEALNGIVRAGAMLNRYLSKVYTGYNPEFLLTNIARDFGAGLINITGKEGAGVAARAVRNYPKAFAALLKYAFTGKASSLITRYREDGGNTGAAYLTDLERLGGQVATEFAAYNGVLKNLKAGDMRNAARAAGRKTFGVALKLLENLNMAGENAMRLAAYEAMLQSGKTRADAASLAKNATVNFNRKGEIGATANALYLFFNAGVQGTAAVVEGLTGKHKYQAWGLTGGMALLGYLLASSLGGADDEEEYDRLDDYAKTRNMVIWSGDGWVKIPVPYGYGFFWNLGRSVADARRTGRTDKLPWHLASSFVEEFTPFGAAVAGEKADSKQFGVGITPTAAQPLTVVIANKTTMGLPLMPENPFDEHQPDRDKKFRGTEGTLADDLAGALESAGVDVSPETLKYLWRTGTGGAGRSLISTVDAATLTAQGAELDIREIPFARLVYTKTDVRGARARYYRLADEAEAAMSEFNRARKRNDFTSMNAVISNKKELMALDKMADRMGKAIKAKRDQVQRIRLNKEYTVTERRVLLKAAEKEEQKLYDMYIDMWKRMAGENRSAAH